MAEKILTLSTTDFDRPSVTIDGESYQMRAAEELSVPMIRRLTDLSKRISEQKEEVELMAEAVAESVSVVMVDLPDEVRDKLTIRQQGKIVETFSGLVADDNAASKTED